MSNGEHISYIIEKVCKKLNINYKSDNIHFNSKTINDAVQLGEIYENLKIILGQLQEIEEKHNLNPQITDALERVIKELDDADHSVIKIAKEILKEKC